MKGFVIKWRLAAFLTSQFRGAQDKEAVLSSAAHPVSWRKSGEIIRRLACLCPRLPGPAPGPVLLLCVCGGGVGVGRILGSFEPGVLGRPSGCVCGTNSPLEAQ